MASLQFPSADALIELLEGLSDVPTHHRWPPNKLQSILSGGGNLLPIEEVVGKFEAGRWLLANPEYQTLSDMLPRQAKRRGGIFELPTAIWSLTSAVVAGLSEWQIHIELGVKPKAPSSADWKNALKGVATLQNLERKGVRLLVATQNGLPLSWLDDLEAALQDADLHAPKPHPDESFADRLAAKEFARWCWLDFGTVPPSWLEAFGAIIGYRAANLSTRLPVWIDQFENHRLYEKSAR